MDTKAVQATVLTALLEIRERSVTVRQRIVLYQRVIAADERV